VEAWWLCWSHGGCVVLFIYVCRVSVFGFYVEVALLRLVALFAD